VKKVLSFNEYKSSRAEVNEGFLGSVLNFFKGLFELISDRKVKKESQDISSYFQKFKEDDMTPEEMEEEIDIKRVRKSGSNMADSIKDRVEVDGEKGVSTNQGLMKSFSSWVAMLISQQESLKLDFFQKMLENPELQKRFVFVPADFREDVTKWYKNSDCKLDPRVKKAWLKLAETPANQLQSAVQEFCKNFIGFVAENSYENGLRRLKNNDKEFIDDVYGGLAAMSNGIVAGMQLMMKNTPDDKIAIMITAKISEEKNDEDENAPQTRSRKAKKAPEASTEEDAPQERSRKKKLPKKV
jgi:hypothetical protein